MLRAGGLLLVLAWAPLPFGSVTPPATAALVAAGLALFALAAAGTSEVVPSRIVRRVAAALVAMAALGGLQSFGWPPGLARFVSPIHAEQSAQTGQILARDQPSAVPLSFAPTTTRRTALVWLLGAAALALGVLHGSSRRVRRGILAVLAMSTLLQLYFGYQQWQLRSTTIWGVEVPNQAVRMRGTFVNPNHLATYLLIASAALFALLWWLFRHLQTTHHVRRWLLRLLPAALLWIALFAGITMTGSRSGMLAGLAAVAIQLALIAATREQRRIVWGGLGILGFAVTYASYSAVEAGFGRLTRLTEQGGFRLEGMADTWKLFTQFPWTGVGLGAFRAAFPLVHPVGEEGTWWHAHNDWLELAATTGLVGLAIAGYGLYWLARGLARSWREGARSEDRAAALAAIGACVAIALQELLEFGLTQPASSFTLAVICGAALAVPRSAVPEVENEAATPPDAAQDEARRISEKSTSE